MYTNGEECVVGIISDKVGGIFGRQPHKARTCTRRNHCERTRSCCSGSPRNIDGKRPRSGIGRCKTTHPSICWRINNIGATKKLRVVV